MQTTKETDEQYGEWPDYVENVIAGEIWLRDPLCPGPEWQDTEELWVSTFVADPLCNRQALTLRKWVKRGS